MRHIRTTVVVLLTIVSSIPVTALARDHGGGGRWGAARSGNRTRAAIGRTWNRSDNWRDNYWNQPGYTNRDNSWNRNFYNYSYGTPSWDTYNLYNYNYRSPYYLPYYYPSNYEPYYYPGSYNPYYYPGRYNASEYGQHWNY